MQIDPDGFWPAPFIKVSADIVNRDNALLGNKFEDIDSMKNPCHTLFLSAIFQKKDERYNTLTSKELVGALKKPTGGGPAGGTTNCF
jgi:hypothetical protein